ncbi:tryptophan--tRNA ligase [Candidatus Mycosynbacter amalyticus]|uniref:Tryptophan--tRNA ligase n=1 Tax=Candidatus Mycosynbacter amalyticus TaxID=2665156 RepID=A0A857MJR7_9BACT|nr:tryptophan--tRNA ligase [Candidatus Mycosynbacter amalyticus]QHN42806.1 tryptophan--tRNA ligase [Candidatus Mycosynbacter amalyticus]
MTNPVILTGLRANNDLQIGNYFGAMLPIIDMAKSRSHDYQVNMFIPDLHSFTTPIDHSELQAQILHNARLYAAAGLPLDDDNIHLYRQSYVPAHSELTWILDCFTGFGEMSRMTQFKDKSGKLGDSQISVGLFNYPVLMAADILLYDAKYVPVGDDQTQHLEFARDIAERMNNRFGELFVVPEPVKAQHEFFGKEQGLRIMDLVNPTKKMSKSDETGKGVIFLGDEPATAAKKIMSATTDDKASVNYNPAEQPGISNLLDILALLRGKPVAEVASQYAGMDRYGDFKKIVADEMQKFLIDLQKSYDTYDSATIVAKLEASERAMNEQAGATLLRVQRAVGLRPPKEYDEI